MMKLIKRKMISNSLETLKDRRSEGLEVSVIGRFLTECLKQDKKKKEPEGSPSQKYWCAG